ncbi:MAG TPA: hypothetical protein VFX24_11955 [Ktedonobacterales bacterium]|jgi:hypothetical protein|nr:hypothetical protein [Ktedonobacterales bacterium]
MAYERINHFCIVYDTDLYVSDGQLLWHALPTIDLPFVESALAP